MTETPALSQARRPAGAIVAGLILLGLGAAFALDNLGLFDAGRIWDWWPLILIGMGLSHLLTGDAFGIATGRRVVVPRRTWGLVFLTAGIFFLLRNFHIVHWRWREVWPYLLVFVGLVVVWRSLRRSEVGPAIAQGPGSLNEFAIFGGGGRTVRSREFRGGEVTAIMGGFEIDLREAELVPEGGHIEILLLMGGIELKVPEHWNVMVRTTPIFGGVEQKASATPSEGKSVRNLLIEGTILMGGLVVKN